MKRLYYDLLQGYIMERHYGGRYSRFNDYKKSLTDANFKILNIIDTTADYHCIQEVVIKPSVCGI
jgi:hypothetical protein